MKKFIVFIILITSIFPSKYVYEIIKGPVEGDISFVKDYDGDDRIFEMSREGYKEKFILSTDGTTKYWSLDYFEEDTSVVATLATDYIVLTGRYKGRTIDKTIKLKGLNWRQIFPYGLEKIEGKKEKFIAIAPNGPKAMESGKMVAKYGDKEEYNFGGQVYNITKVEVALSGLLKFFWSGEYWYDIDKEVVVRFDETGLEMDLKEIIE